VQLESVSLLLYLCEVGFGWTSLRFRLTSLGLSEWMPPGLRRGGGIALGDMVVVSEGSGGQEGCHFECDGGRVPRSRFGGRHDIETRKRIWRRGRPVLLALLAFASTWSDWRKTSRMY